MNKLHSDFYLQSRMIFHFGYWDRLLRQNVTLTIKECFGSFRNYLEAIYQSIQNLTLQKRKN